MPKRKGDINHEQAPVNDRETWVPEVYDLLQIRHQLDILNAQVAENRREMKTVLQKLLDIDFFKKRFDMPVTYHPLSAAEESVMGGTKRIRYTEETKFESFSQKNAARLLAEFYQNFFNGRVPDEECNSFGTQCVLNAWGNRKAEIKRRIRCDPVKKKSSERVAGPPSKKVRKQTVEEMRESQVGKILLEMRNDSEQ